MGTSFCSSLTERTRHKADHLKQNCPLKKHPHSPLPEPLASLHFSASLTRIRNPRALCRRMRQVRQSFPKRTISACQSRLTSRHAYCLVKLSHAAHLRDFPRNQLLGFWDLGSTDLLTVDPNMKGLTAAVANANRFDCVMTGLIQTIQWNLCKLDWGSMLNFKSNSPQVSTS